MDFLSFYKLLMFLCLSCAAGSPHWTWPIWTLPYLISILSSGCCFRLNAWWIPWMTKPSLEPWGLVHFYLSIIPVYFNVTISHTWLPLHHTVPSVTGTSFCRQTPNESVWKHFCTSCSDENGLEKFLIKPHGDATGIM